MAVRFNPEGAWTALVTPFDKRGRVNLTALQRLVEFQISQGISGLVPAGTTGESPTLSWREHVHLIGATVKYAKHEVGVLAGTGSNCTSEAITATSHAYVAGASACLLVDCYYNGPSSLELRTEYYEAVLETVPKIPLVPYIIPGRCGTALAAEDLAFLHLKYGSRLPAVKEATGDLARMRCDRALAGPRLAILSGDDDLTLTMMQDPQIAAAGVISVISNVVPAGVARMVAAQRAGDAAQAGELNRILTPLFKLVACKAPGERHLPDGRVLALEDKFRNPVPIKTMLAGLGLPVGFFRQPLGRMSRAGVETCRAALRQVYGDAPDLLKPLEAAFNVDVERRLADDGVWAALARA